MTTSDLQTKLQQFDEFFSIAHEFNVNLRPLSLNEVPTYDTFIAAMPIPFKMASDMVTIEQSAIRSIQGLGSVATQLTEFLNHQSHKIDLLVGYILSQQDDESMRYQGVKFGGGGVIFTSEQSFEIPQRVEMKIFLLQENCAVFCIGEIVESCAVGSGFEHKVIFEFIREEDQETLVRHSLHQQSKQLQALAQKRREEQENNLEADKS